MDADSTSRDRCRFRDLCIDVTDQHRLAPFWAAALGLEAEALDNGGYRLGDDVAEHTVWINPVPEPRSVKQRVHLDVGVPVAWVFQAVPEPKRVKNRIHWDLLGDTAGLLGSGATLLRSRGDDLVWDVLADPEGNEFCVFPAQ
ncbi:MAG TPA: VOC family protein [Microlunatus sp.]